MSAEPNPAAKLGMEFVLELQRLLQQQQTMSWRYGDVVVKLDRSNIEIKRSGTPPTCAEGDFAHLKIPVQLWVSGAAVTSSRELYTAITFNSIQNTIAIEYVFGENETSVVSLSWKPDGRALAFSVEISSIGLSADLDVSTGPSHVDHTGRIHDAAVYVDPVMDRIRRRTARLVNQIRPHLKLYPWSSET